MRVPLAIPTDIRFHLGGLGIPPDDDASVISGYGCLRFLEHIVKIRNWKIPYAAYKNEGVHQSLAAVFPETVQAMDQLLDVSDFWKTFTNAYDAVTKMSFESFVKNVCPGFATEPDACLQIFESKEIEVKSTHELSRCLHAIFTWKARAESVEQSYVLYREFMLYTSLSALPREDFYELYGTVNCYALSKAPHTKSLTKAAEAYRIFLSAYVPVNFQIEFYEILQHRIKNRKIENVFQYLRERPRGHHILFETLAGLESELNRASVLLRGVTPSAFLESLMIESSPRRRGDIPDAVTECSYCYTQVKSYLIATGAKRVLIAYPSMPFIRQWIKDEVLGEIETCFLMQYESSANILTVEFSHAANCKFTSAKDPVEESDLYLLFHRTYADDTRQSVYEQLIESGREGTVFYLLPDEKAKLLIRKISSVTQSRVALDAVDILPTEVFSSQLKKKVFLRIVQKGTRESVEMGAHLFVKDPLLGNVLYPVRKTVKTPVVDLCGADTLRTIYRNQGVVLKTERKRNLACCYEFSPELKVWYALNPPKDDAVLTPKVKAYLCEYPTETQQSRNFLKRGKAIKGACIWKTNYPKEAIPDWIGYTAVFAPKIYNAAKALIEQRYGKHPISLRTFWYLHTPDGLSMETNHGMVLNWFIRGKEAEELMVGRSRKADYMAAVDQFFENRLAEENDECRDEYLRYVWDFLCDLLDLSVDEGYYKVNPIEDLVSRVRIRHSEFSELREALTKKTFTVEEERQFLMAQDEESPALALGALIRLYTGMPPMQVCALRYRDFQAIPHTGHYQFLIYEKVTRAGSAPKPLRRPEEYRRIPVIPALAERIEAQIRSLEERHHIRVKNSDYFIVSGDLQGDTIPAKLQPYAPSTLQKYCKRKIEALGIEHVTLMIPDEEDGMRKSDFTEYQADIFRTNLRYRLKNTCGFTNSECDYLLGVQLKNTFAKHYCDFTNPFSQIAMLTKMSWWSALHQTEGESPAKKALSLRNTHLKVSPVGTGCASTLLSLQVSPEGERVPANITITIHSKNGCDGSVNVIREVQDYET